MIEVETAGNLTDMAQLLTLVINGIEAMPTTTALLTLAKDSVLPMQEILALIRQHLQLQSMNLLTGYPVADSVSHVARMRTQIDIVHLGLLFLSQKVDFVRRTARQLGLAGQGYATLIDAAEDLAILTETLSAATVTVQHVGQLIAQEAPAPIITHIISLDALLRTIQLRSEEIKRSTTDSALQLLCTQFSLQAQNMRERLEKAKAVGD
jgi:hypothetical protein